VLFYFCFVVYPVTEVQFSEGFLYKPCSSFVGLVGGFAEDYEDEVVLGELAVVDSVFECWVSFGYVLADLNYTLEVFSFEPDTAALVYWFIAFFGIG